MVHGCTFALSALNARPWVGLEFCPCILLCLTSVPSWCCYFPRVRVLSKLHKLQPGLDDSAFSGFCTFCVRLHIMTQPPQITVLAFLEEW